MKKQRLLSVTFVLVVVSLLAVTPVFANAEGECSHAASTVASLRDCVTHAAEMGHIDNQGVGNSLLAKLDAAQIALDRQQTPVAVAKLEAFLHEVEAQAGKHIDKEHAEHMAMHAQDIIKGLSH